MQNVLNYGFQHPLTWEVSFLLFAFFFGIGRAARQVIRAWHGRVFQNKVAKLL